MQDIERMGPLFKVLNNMNHYIRASSGGGNIFERSRINMGRHDDSYDIRVKAAKIARDRDHADSHRNNGEERKYKDADGNRNFIANYTKGFRHHPKTDRDAG